MHRPRVRSYDGHEVALPTWTAAQAEDWLGRRAMNLMLINVSSASCGVPSGCPRAICQASPLTMAPRSQRPRAGSWHCLAQRLAEWMASDLSKLDLLVIQIDGLHIGNDLVLVAALGIDGEGHKIRSP